VLRIVLETGPQMLLVACHVPFVLDN